MYLTTDMTGLTGWSSPFGDSATGSNITYFGGDQALLVAGLGNDTLSGSDSSIGDWISDSWAGIVDGNGDDIFHGRAGNDTLVGEIGNDTLSGEVGNDSLYGGADNDSIYGGTGSDYLDGGDGNDLLRGNAEGDVLYGGAGDDTLGGLPGDDSLYGGEGSDKYRIDSAADVVSDDGTTGWDLIVTRSLSIDLADYTGIEDVTFRGDVSLDATGDAESNQLIGNAGSNVLTGLGSHDVLRGGAGADSLYGGDGEDWMQGNPGADLLDGGNGADTLVGGYGRDTLTGGEGADVFIFNTAGQTPPGSFRDSITDFTSGEDVIDLSGFMAGAALVASFTATGGMEIRFDSRLDRLSGDTNGDGVADWAITLTGVDSISASDLLLIS